MSQLKLQRIHPAAVVPTYGSAGAACFDFHAVEAGTVPAGGAHTFRTGWNVEVPEGYVMLIYSRSGHGFKMGLRLANCTGVIDSDYRGEMMARLHNDTAETDVVFKAGDRVAQGLLLPIPRAEMQIVDELSPTVRGLGGFGSTGA